MTYLEESVLGGNAFKKCLKFPSIDHEKGGSELDGNKQRIKTHAKGMKISTKWEGYCLSLRSRTTRLKYSTVKYPLMMSSLMSPQDEYSFRNWNTFSTATGMQPTRKRDNRGRRRYDQNSHTRTLTLIIGHSSISIFGCGLRFMFVFEIRFS